MTVAASSPQTTAPRAGAPFEHATEPANERAAEPANERAAGPANERAAGARSAGEPVNEPRLDFAGLTPYDEYVKASTLHRLQQPRSADPGEMAFLVTTQVMELWFGLLVYEWHTACGALAEDRLDDALASLRRSVAELRALAASWTPVSSLTPAQFNAYRSALGEASGFQSAAYREMEFLLGEKSASLLQPHADAPHAYAQLEQALHAPSLYDTVLDFLHRRGFDVPREVLDRDLSQRYEPHPGVEAVWVRIYTTGDEPLVQLGEVLTDIAELFGRWRTDHLMATRRAMGAKRGTGGSSGVAWLEKRAARLVFPELWTARGHV
ncbi:tryptophan 2,3-dioxygenase [Gandjariella thermophila]|uniref:Tryptophan 2,3-dioxygenase n=1 Tax=Gandjariella thermophila TaxID=1931992 RepID=A0A4D4JF24_9PSEU|nr:tryptophan 2,3-dioxygenase [Gandjariella thermophila]